MLKISVLAFASLFCSNIIAQQLQDLHSLLPKGTQVSYLVVDPVKKGVVTSHQEDTLRTPASVQKLLTATASTLYLGKDFRYKTVIQGNKKSIKNGQYEGDISLVFTGDPTLTRKHIKAMLQSLKRSGIKKINGDFLLDNSHFNGYQWSDGQAWNDLGVCYTSPSNAIIINRNCVLGNLSLKKSNAKKATLFIPAYEPVDITSDVKVVTKAQRKAESCALELTRNSQNKYHLLGCMVPRKRAFGLAFSVNDPEDYAQKIIESELSKVGIILNGSIKIDPKGANKINVTTLVSHESSTLAVLVAEMMKDSDNLIADSLFKTMGGQYFKQPGNFRNGAKAMKAILKEHNIDLENAYLADGSGLSRHNLMSSSLFMSLLQFVYNEDKKLGLIDSFSISGVDGTLKYHKGVNSAVMKGKVIAKTGSLKGVANLVGLVKTEQGDKLFVLIINGYNIESMTEANPANKTALVKSRKSKAPVYLFEEAFFEMIMSGNFTRQ